MRKYHYTIGIVSGLVVGALVGLYLGNSLTGVLGGSLSALAVGWAISLDWCRRAIKEVAIKATQNTGTIFNSARGIGQSWISRIVNAESRQEQLWELSKPVAIPAIFVLVFWAVVFGIAIAVPLATAILILLLIVAWMLWLYDVLLKPLAMMAYLTFASPGIRKALYYDLAVAVLTAVIIGPTVYWFRWIFINWVAQSSSETCLAIAMISLAAASLITGAWGVYFILKSLHEYYDSCYYLRKANLKDLSNLNGYSLAPDFELADYFFTSWFNRGMDDNRSPLRSVLYMLAIRTLNAFSPLIWLALFLWWLPRALTTQKTVLAAITAGGLSALHLSICFYFGWIQVWEINFWLSLGLAAAIGAKIGCLIHSSQRLQMPQLPKWPSFAHSEL
jgi:hypothetical protein